MLTVGVEVSCCCHYLRLLSPISGSQWKFSGSHWHSLPPPEMNQRAGEVCGRMWGEDLESTLLMFLIPYIYRWMIIKCDGNYFISFFGLTTMSVLNTKLDLITKDDGMNWKNSKEPHDDTNARIQTHKSICMRRRGVSKQAQMPEAVGRGGYLSVSVYSGH